MVLNLCAVSHLIFSDPFIAYKQNILCVDAMFALGCACVLWHTMMQIHIMNDLTYTLKSSYLSCIRLFRFFLPWGSILSPKLYKLTFRFFSYFLADFLIFILLVISMFNFHSLSLALYFLFSIFLCTIVKIIWLLSLSLSPFHSLSVFWACTLSSLWRFSCGHIKILHSWSRVL